MLTASVPNGWKIMSIGDFTVEHKQGYYTKQQYESKGVLLARITDLGNPKVNFCSMPKLDVSEKDYQAFKVCKGDFLFARSGAIGRYGIVKIEPPRTIFASYLIRFRFNEQVNSYYVGQVYESELTQAQIKAISQGNANININAENIKKLKMLVPPLKEQQKIAEVLSTVDKKIDLINQKIVETEKLKTGLMQKLFSQGVGVQDSDGSWLPHSEFQDSPLGKMPKCWEVETLGEHTIKVGSGVTPKGGSKAYVDSGIPLIRSQNVLFGKFKLDDVAFITEQQHDKMKGSKLQPKDVLLNITGASIGRCAVLPEDFDEGNVNQHVCIIRTSESIDPDFCGWFLNSNLGQKQIWNLQAGGNREGLNFQQIRSFKIPVFSIEEQCSIVEILSTVSDKLNLLETQKSETQQLKKGLMQKLLTGEWRVPLDSTDTA
ncbi:restriction endonuclease subunit S [Aliivibrio sp. S3MY1]|uniref:restriction endonuclease subunit S n=1 Tax=Aliivibrio sp. S3MY1 TaxID=3028424 RepID=UPI0023799995|nr:restriction endonuclease subunit S [Aliivibrio sp. S3MY1]MDD9196097.1 restriction endonuclease subunit S [Aliivibrio sp. S3MY1]